jgi:protein-tyrosine-phosphatase
MRNTISTLIFAAAFTAAALAIPAQRADEAASRTPTVLFMCPRGAAKSVLASAYFQRLAKERGLNVRVLTGGTEPDTRLAPQVASHLITNGYELPVPAPRRVTADDMASADVVISIGCRLEGLPPTNGRIVAWDDVPSTSDQFARADSDIRERVLRPVEELAAM